MAIVVAVAVLGYAFFGTDHSESSPARRPPSPAPAPIAQLTSQSIVRTLSQSDPDFSLTLLEDFAYRLYATAQRARHDPRRLAALAPYFSEDVRGELAIDLGREAQVSYVVIGALKLTELRDSNAGFTDLTLEYIANLGRERAGVACAASHVEEEWVLRRAHGAHTRPPEEVLRLGCPNCAAPFVSTDHRRCDHCGEVVSDGRFTWHVVARSVRQARDVRASLLTTVEEAGTHSPSCVDPENDVMFASLQRSDPHCSEGALRARASATFDALNRAWNACDPEAMRPLVTEAMLDYLRYWLGAYDALGLQNLAQDAKVLRIERVKVVRDRHFDAITLRIWASCYDVTLDIASQEPVAGSAAEIRRYSEYWTFVRSAQARRAESVACLGCSAPLRVQQSGVCPHCGTPVLRGQHDWVLSKIEQDDVYG